MGKIHNVEKLTDNRFVNLYHVDATSVHNTPVSYFVASRAKTVSEMKLKTGKNDPDGVIIYSLYGEKKDRVVLIRQYRYTWRICIRISCGTGGSRGRFSRRGSP